MKNSLVYILFAIGMLLLTFLIGYKLGQQNVSEYKIVLENQDAEIILETLDEIISRQEVNNNLH